ncbi:sugar ABC transporter substrate-binding protein [Leptolyngbya sp. FACHB-17]|uniref:sugar ABC transporter substrate-binding protein n=1 Tax=unclassified Leptolyngbya TaxID=2650499 RepID=UPI001680C0D6|nr:sugar ABC transporter substrate-binding protein [Leptolyngbya sp. FACHB-17]MBD2081190.1 sugar ABC transporter substrate-binding protein [Leptolyngbya sp. FACHB-17]
MKRFSKLIYSFLPLMIVAMFAACSSQNNAANNSANNPTSGTNTDTRFAAARGCKNIGVLLPESDSSARYEAYDRPLLEKEIKAQLPDATIQYANANNNADTQQNQAEAALTKGACILVVDPQDSDKASVIVQKAKASQVPVIAYDRFIQDPDVTYYVSFDNVRVGELQGQYIADQFRRGAYGLKPGANLVMINGSQTDNNALQFREGALKALQPLVDSKQLNLVFDQYTPNWDNARAQSIMEGILTQQRNNVQAAYVANDGMANTVIAALRAQKLDGKVLVTGQDATLTGIQNILTGDQAMTIYKPIAKEAQVTAQLVAALSKGSEPGAIVNGQTALKSGGQVASALITPIAVDKTNVQQTVLADGYLNKAQVCNGLSGDTTGICRGVAQGGSDRQGSL